MPQLLKVENLTTQFKTDYGLIKAVDGVSYHIDEGEVVGIVGESGCGKSVTQMSVMQLVRPPGKIVSGRVNFDGQDLLQFKPESKEMRSIRGGKISMIFQEPMTALNPVLTIGQQLTEMLEMHLKMDYQAARARSIELLNMVGISGARNRIDSYPHQFSGGMCQRVMIAMALSCNPRILIADEPTTALDVTIQAQLLELMQDVVTRLKTSLVLVTHNLGIIVRYTQRIYVMYAGRIVESGSLNEVFNSPRHPYTIGLLKCVPRMDKEQNIKLPTIEGAPPNLVNMPNKCAFLPRCSSRFEKCDQEPSPELKHVGRQQYVACYAVRGSE